MKRATLLVVLLLATMGSPDIEGQEPSSSAPDFTGHDLLAACTQQMRRITGGPLTLHQTHQAGSCVGFLIAIHVAETESPTYCPPDRWRTLPDPVAHNDLVRAVVLDLMRRREDLDDRGDILVAGSLRDAFPCQ